MNEIEKLQNRLRELGIFCWSEDGQVNFNSQTTKNINNNIKTVNKKPVGRQEYDQEADEK